MGIGAGHHDLAGFDGLPQGFQHLAREFRQFVQKQNPVVGQADFARCRTSAAANNGRHGGRVMGFAKRALFGNPALIQQTRQGMDHAGFQRFDR